MKCEILSPFPSAPPAPILSLKQINQSFLKKNAECKDSMKYKSGHLALSSPQWEQHSCHSHPLKMCTCAKLVSTPFWVRIPSQLPSQVTVCSGAKTTGDTDGSEPQQLGSPTPPTSLLAAASEPAPLLGTLTQQPHSLGLGLPL